LRLEYRRNRSLRLGLSQPLTRRAIADIISLTRSARWLRWQLFQQRCWCSPLLSWFGSKQLWRSMI